MQIMIKIGKNDKRRSTVMESVYERWIIRKDYIVQFVITRLFVTTR